MGKYFHSVVAGAAIFLIFGAIVQAALDPAGWGHARRIAVRDSAAPEAYLLVELDGEVYQASRKDLADLRVVDDLGNEVPLEIITPRDQSTEEEYGAEILDRQSLPDGTFKFVLDLGEDPPRHNRVELTTSSKNFSRRVAVEAGDDLRHWAFIRQDGYIFNFSRDTTAEYLLVDYPVSTRRYLRVSIFNPKEEPIEVSDASVSFYLSQPARTNPLAAVIKERIEDPKTKQTRITVDLGVAGIPSSRIELQTDARNFHRHVEIEGRDSLEEMAGQIRQYWSSVDNGQIFSVELERVKRRQIELEYAETRYRFLRLIIDNNDDRPLEISGIKVLGYPRQVLFRREPGRQYRLLYGNREAKAPSYDLTKIVSYLKLGELETVSLGEEMPGALPPAAPQRPWLDRQPIALWITLVLAASILGGLIYRLARKIGAD